ncbi:DNA-binding transcriptional response regulator, NtrC family, contains REC, AAA-type ATPase, and a Fis-type DNA-binding domains [Pedobacter steynii]|uniref:DNA-binding transcriptional response regulator, NtrC family, contains REC, AAA-type ATPase, and a Fis-type DNA-binding domains n=1 Tax=Pedobacter steynii TaxID=430522 RepID=A0A1G9L248_9SPHI|nr:sigma-54 dependent transcriptional regulator [Pedobacter steynii]NQX38707.1 sigma-54-dependent Fis family transcriptional regulator [Pedobacter steynii]SDL56029.1 DNA-binding transcriptional response regulator, NtrC family, contains REC, AAA-type ATPase, and a Fis-type DNA-binding domains [Pedobacter steynii]
MILIIDDDIAVCASLSLLLKQNGFKSIKANGPEEALKHLKEKPIAAVLLDMNFSMETTGEDGLAMLQQIKKSNPMLPVILMTGWGSIKLAVEGMKSGATDFINKPWDNDYLIHALKTALDLSAEQDTPATLTRKKLNEKYGFENIVGEDPQLLEVLQTIARVSRTDASVLIIGESGTGKELVAEAIHENSPRKHKAFVKVNLGGISSSLFESEMFGHKRGAFTDARNDRIGRFELADKGTIFLDEIGDLDLNSQVKLLRVLQDRKYEVLGDSRTRTVDLRVVCATNRDLREMIAGNKFREDLYYRINLIIIRLPPLRERADDIPILANYFLKNLKEIYNRPKLQIDKKTFNWLKSLPLPGNIRELKNLIERTVLLSEADLLEIKDFEQHLEAQRLSNTPLTLPAVGTLSIDEMELSMIRNAMNFYQNNISKVAKTLGLSRGTLYRKLEKYNIPYETQN